MIEQDAFIEVLKLLPSYANHFKAGPSFGQYVPFVLQLEDYMLKWPSLVRFLPFCQQPIFIKNAILLSILHWQSLKLLICMLFNRGSLKLLRLAGCLDSKALSKLFVHDHGVNLSNMITTLKVDQMAVSESKHGGRQWSRRNHNLETSCSLFSIMDNLDMLFGFISFHLRVLIRSQLVVVNLNNQVIQVKPEKIFVLD